MQPEIKDVLVLGGGPSGIAAAYSLQLGLDTTLISPDLGGKINYPFSPHAGAMTQAVRGSSMVRDLAAQLPPASHIPASATGVEADDKHVTVTLDDGRTFQGQSLIYAAGVQPRKLHIPGEAELRGKGLSYSAVSHAMLCARQDVAVVGNHARAQVAVITLARIARRVVFIVPFGSSTDAVSDDFLSQVARHDNLTVIMGWNLSAIEGREYVTRLLLHNERGGERFMPVNVLFIEMQLLPNTDLIAHLVARDEAGHIQVNQRCATSHPRIFAAGDVTDIHCEQVPVAVGEGIKAALSASALIGWANASSQMVRSAK